MTNPVVQELQSELARLREERQKDKEQQLLNRISDLEKKLETGGTGTPMMQRLEAIEKRLEGGGQPPTMTIYDDKSNPMVLPYDRSFMAALQRKMDVEAEAVKTTQLMEILKVRGGDDSKLTPILERLQKDQEAANKRVEELKTALQDQRVQHLEERVAKAEELAASAGGDSKGILDLAAEAGADMRSGAAEAVTALKEGIDKTVERVTDAVKNRPTSSTPAANRSPDQIVGIMEAENQFLTAIGEK